MGTIVKSDLIFIEKEFKVYKRELEITDINGHVISYYDFKIEKDQYPSIFINEILPHQLNYNKIELIYRETRQFNYELYQSETDGDN